MIKNNKKIPLNESYLYNNILSLSRNKFFYINCDLVDNFQNRILLIFMHISFIFVKMKKNNKDESIKKFDQNMFDIIFNKIELNMRELGYGDTVINKKMKLLVKTFYNILFFCENYKNKTLNSKNEFFSNYLLQNNRQNTNNNSNLVDYFNKYQSFCFDLNPYSVLSGDLNFNYK